MAMRVPIIDNQATITNADATLICMLFPYLLSDGSVVGIGFFGANLET